MLRNYIDLSERILSPIFKPLSCYISKRLSSEFSGWSIADVGGGTGQWLETFLDYEISAGYLFDLELEMISCAWHRLKDRPKAKIFFEIVAAAEELPLGARTIDLVVSRNSMHLWNDQQKALQEIARILKPNGFSFVGRGYGPDLDDSLREQIKMNRRMWHNEMGSEQEEPSSLPPEEVAKMCQNVGLKVIEIIPDSKSYWILAKK